MPTDAELAEAYMESVLASCRLVCDAALWPQVEPLVRESAYADSHGLRAIYELGITSSVEGLEK